MDEGSEQTNNYNTFDDVPIRGISPETKSLLSAYLNPTKLFPAPPPTDLPR